MGLVIWPPFDPLDYLSSAPQGTGEDGMDGRPEYAIAGSYAESMRWRADDPEARGESDVREHGRAG